MPSDEKPALGLRERKKAKTRAAIQQHALRLFREQGYDSTTIEQIAEAAEISPSTFFRYFPTKEDVVLTDEYDARIVEAFHALPADLSPIQAMRTAMKLALASMSSEELAQELERAKLLMTVPVLRAAFLNSLSETIQMISGMVANRVGRAPNDFAVQTFAGAVYGVGMTVSIKWMQNPELDFQALLDEAMGYLEAGLPL